MAVEIVAEVKKKKVTVLKVDLVKKKKKKSWEGHHLLSGTMSARAWTGWNIWVAVCELGGQKITDTDGPT